MRAPTKKAPPRRALSPENSKNNPGPGSGGLSRRRVGREYPRASSSAPMNVGRQADDVAHNRDIVGPPPLAARASMHLHGNNIYFRPAETAIRAPRRRGTGPRISGPRILPPPSAHKLSRNTKPSFLLPCRRISLAFPRCWNGSVAIHDVRGWQKG